MIDVTEINIATGEVIQREYTQEEKASRDQRQSEPSAEAVAKLAEAQASDNLEYIELKQSAINKLVALGLTEQEALALVGI
jgi:hypothetical protein